MVESQQNDKYPNNFNHETKMKGKTNAVSGTIPVPTITTIRIDNSISDPKSIITIIKDTGGIKDIRINSHRYLSKKTSDGEITICMLADYDSTRYADGGSADLTGGSGDVFMRLPEFYYKATQIDVNIWDVSFAYGGKPDGAYKKWEGNDLIGVYEAYIVNNAMYSVSGKTSTGNVSLESCRTYARNRGNGFTLVRWEHHSIMAFLSYAYFITTDCKNECGSGSNSSTKVTGGTNSYGMRDTQGNNATSINFWGLENWWGNKYEWIDNARAYNDILTITADDGSTRSVPITTSGGYISSIGVGSELDANPTNAKASSTTSYCSYIWASTGDNAVARSSDDNGADCGMVTIACNYATTYVRSSAGSRLAFRGNIIENNDSTEFKKIIALG